MSKKTKRDLLQIWDHIRCICIGVMVWDQCGNIWYGMTAIVLFFEVMQIRHKLDDYEFFVQEVNEVNK